MGSTDPDNWKEIQFIKDRIASEDDVKSGRAVFYIENEGVNHQPLAIQIPSLAYQIDQETKEKKISSNNSRRTSR